MSILNRQVNYFSNFASFFFVITHNSPANFKPMDFLLWIKVPRKSPDFETFKCSGENLPNSLCHFPNHKSVFLQILRHSLVSWKNPMKVPILTHTFKCYGEDLPNSSFHFPNHKSVFLQILYDSLVLWKIIPLYFFKRDQSKSKFLRLLSTRIKLH